MVLLQGKTISLREGMKLRKTQLSYRLKKMNGNVRRDGKIWNTGVALLKYFAGLNSNQNGQYGQIYRSNEKSVHGYAKGAAEMKEMNIPVGVSDFEEIRKNGYYYIDKSGLIGELISRTGTKVTLITRPRRFGKTLGMPALQSLKQSTRRLWKIWRVSAIRLCSKLMIGCTQRSMRTTMIRFFAMAFRSLRNAAW